MTADVSDDRPAFMLDTNVFNRLADKSETYPLDMEALAVLCSLKGPECGRWLATGIQLDELRQTKDVPTRETLVATFIETGAALVPASSFAFDIDGADFDHAHWNDNSGLVEQMLKRLSEIESPAKKRGRQKILNKQRKKAEREHDDGSYWLSTVDRNPIRDILIAETALKAEATLVTGDRALYQVAIEFGIGAIYAPPAKPS